MIKNIMPTSCCFLDSVLALRFLARLLSTTFFPSMSAILDIVRRTERTGAENQT